MRERVIGRVQVIDKCGSLTVYALIGKRETVKRFIKSNAKHLRKYYGNKNVKTNLKVI